MSDVDRPNGSYLPPGVMLFDGACVLRSGWFGFVARRNRAVRFRFVAIQDEMARSLATVLGVDPDSPATNALVLGGRVFVRSDVAIEILRHLLFWRWIIMLRLVLRPVRDRLYDAGARSRYRLFGRTIICLVPKAALRRHMLLARP